jgi:hypothetical protein
MELLEDAAMSERLLPAMPTHISWPSYTRDSFALLRKTTKELLGWKLFANGNALFERGHSGARLELLPNGCVKKSGDVVAIDEELRYMNLLPEAFMPRIITSCPGAYVMERLYQVNNPGVLHILNTLARKYIWSYDQHDSLWIEDFETRFNESPPKWVWKEHSCLIHGDLTAGNLMRNAAGDYILIDPKPPGRGIPSYRSVDRGKLLQSLLGWEAFHTGEVPLIDYDWPFMLLNKLDLRRAVYWCRIHLLRIMQREDSSSITYLWARVMARSLAELIE